MVHIELFFATIIALLVLRFLSKRINEETSTWVLVVLVCGYAAVFLISFTPYQEHGAKLFLLPSLAAILLGFISTTKIINRID
jgi:hypothetical protein